MVTMGKYVSASAITWSIRELSKLPKDQLALIFALVISKAPEVEYPKGNFVPPFLEEMQRYLSAPKSKTKMGIFNPIDSQWRADNYYQSTVFGRLLNGSHSWTSPEVGYFERTPKSGWPAKLTFTEDGYRRLFLRTSPPCLKFEYRLPILAIAIYYYRQINLAERAVKTPEDLVRVYTEDVLDSNEHLTNLFVHELPIFWGQLFQDEAITEEEYIACFVEAGATSGQLFRIQDEDLEILRTHTPSGISIEEFLHQAIQKLKEEE